MTEFESCETGHFYAKLFKDTAWNVFLGNEKGNVWYSDAKLPWITTCLGFVQCQWVSLLGNWGFLLCLPCFLILKIMYKINTVWEKSSKIKARAKESRDASLSFFRKLRKCRCKRKRNMCFYSYINITYQSHTKLYCFNKS